MFRKRDSYVAIVVAGLLIQSGCQQNSGPPTASLAGSVTIGGNPVPEDAEGHIQFMTTEKGQAHPASAEIVDGKYQADKVPVGNIKVIFNITRLTGRMVKEDNAPGATPYPEKEDLVPAEHRRGILSKVEGDNDAQDFQL